MELKELLYKEKRTKKQIGYYQQVLSAIQSKIKLLDDSKDISNGNEYFLNKLSLENEYRNTFQKYFEKNENANFNLFDIQKKIAVLSNELKGLNKTKNEIEMDPDLQLKLYDLQQKVIKATKDIETLKNKKASIQSIQVLQSPVSKELPKVNNIKRNTILLSVVGLFVMSFLSFFLEYLNNYKNRRSIK